MIYSVSRSRSWQAQYSRHCNMVKTCERKFLRPPIDEVTVFSVEMTSVMCQVTGLWECLFTTLLTYSTMSYNFFYYDTCVLAEKQDSPKTMSGISSSSDAFRTWHHWSPEDVAKQLFELLQVVEKIVETNQGKVCHHELFLWYVYMQKRASVRLISWKKCNKNKVDTNSILSFLPSYRWNQRLPRKHQALTKKTTYLFKSTSSESPTTGICWLDQRCGGILATKVASAFATVWRRPTAVLKVQRRLIFGITVWPL